MSQTNSQWVGQDASQHMQGVRCPHCEHVTYIDKRRVCSDTETVVKELVRGDERGNEHRIVVTCEACGKTSIIQVDCTPYRAE